MGLESHSSMFAPLPPRSDGRRNLVGLSKAEIHDAVLEMGESAFRAKQLWHWIYYRGVTDFEAMTNLAKPLRTRMAERFVIERPTVARALESFDGTRKWLLRLADGQEVEAVHIPEDDRGALCVSSQVGCTLNCRFCHTGTQRLVRNLEPAEIVGQAMLARDALNEWGIPHEDRRFTNIVMMGMGEPLYNYDNVAKALSILMDGDGFAMSKRRITLSTSGVVPMMRKCGEELDVNLAVSLHAARDDLRDELVPLNRKYPIAELLDACRSYPGTSNARRITFEYVMLKGVNDSAADARELVRRLDGLPAKVNLIPFNPWPGAPYECSTQDRIRVFAEILMNAGYSSPVRATRGQDIMAACGQLKSDSVRQRRRVIDKTAPEASSPDVSVPEGAPAELSQAQ
ncbi:23S rRNA (adenine(2503)-C(2))-methyltransferase RlmN [Fodinicurvata sp. EGI_FJ10296]|uniref:23S rRNA (adenine(2503)-C(2))-methyltransferase RlmN n=1 Tax=Fodinicurvata sp. EGI_FJ10296 TaxID=3231908 RepID=UPI0034561B51